MAVALSSLRVTAEMDPSAYTRGSQAVATANQSMIASADALGQAWAKQDVAADRAGQSFARVSREFITGYGEAAKFEAAVRRVGAALDRSGGDTASLERAGVTLDAIYRKYGLVADAATLAKQGFNALVPVVAQLNQHYAIQADIVNRATVAQQQLSAAQQAQATINARLGVREFTGGAAQTSADAFLAGVGGLEGVARAQALQVAQAFTAELDSRLIAGVSKSARDSASIFSAQFKEMEAIAALKAEQAGAVFGASLNEAMIAGISKSARESASVFQAEFDRIDEIARLKAEQAGQNFQKSFNDAMGIGGPVKSAAQSASVWQDIDKEVDRLTKNYAPLIQAEKQHRIEQEEIAKAYDMGIFGMKGTTEAQNAMNAALANSNSKLYATKEALGQVGGASRLMAGTWTQLSFQINDVVTGLLIGQPLWMIFSQQGGQIYQVWSQAAASIGGFGAAAKAAFNSTMDFVKGLLTPVNLLIAALVTFGTTLAAAVLHYQSAQREISRGLFGTGAASGATPADINSIASGSSSAVGLSVGEARDLAVTLASTGKIGVQALGPIVSLGKGIQQVLGVDATEAAKMMAKEFGDAANTTGDLQDKLGYLDAKTAEFIERSVAAGDVQAAQRARTEALAQSLKGASELTGVWAKTWDLVGNAASGVFNKIGRDLSGPSQSTIVSFTQMLRDAASSIGGNDSGIVRGLDSALAAAQAKIDAAAAKNQEKLAAQKSRAVQVPIENITPEFSQLEKLEDALKNVNAQLADPAVSAHMKDLDQAALAQKRLNDAVEGFMSPLQRAAAIDDLAIQSIYAHSTAERALIAEKQKRIDLGGKADQQFQEEAKNQAAYTAGIKVSAAALEQLNEETRQQVLAAQQSLDSVNLIGRYTRQRGIGGAGAAFGITGGSQGDLSIAEREKLRGELRIEQQIEREISDLHAQNDPKQLAALKEREDKLKAINAQNAIAIQQGAVAQEQSKLALDAQRTLQSGVQGTVNTTLRPIFGNDQSGAQAVFLANQVRMVEALKETANPQELVRKGFDEMKAAIDAIANGDSTSFLSRWFGEQMPAAIAKLRGDLKAMSDAFKTQFELGQATNAIAMQAVTAYSPAAKAEIVYQQTKLQLMQGVKNEQQRVQALILAEEAAVHSLAQSYEQLKEAQRERLLAARQSTATAAVEISTIGKTVGETYRLQTVEQARQQLEQESARNRTAFDYTKLANLAKEIEQTAKLKQLMAQLTLESNTKFDRQTAFFTPEDLKIAQAMRNIYGDEWKQHMDDAIADQMRLNMLLQDMNNSVVQSSLGNLTTSLADITTGTKRAGDAFRDLGSKVLRSLEEMLIKMTITLPIARALQSVLSSISPSFGGTAGTDIYAAGEAGAIIPAANGGIGHARSGGMVGSLPSAGYIHPAYFDDAPRMRSGGYITDDGVPIVAHPGERILNADETRAYNNAQGGAPKVIINNYSGGEVSQKQSKDASGQDVVEIVIDRVKQEYGSGGFDSVNKARYGIGLRGRPR